MSMKAMRVHHGTGPRHDVVLVQQGHHERAQSRSIKIKPGQWTGGLVRIDRRAARPSGPEETTSINGICDTRRAKRRAKPSAGVCQSRPKREKKPSGRERELIAGQEGSRRNCTGQVLPQ